LRGRFILGISVPFLAIACVAQQPAGSKEPAPIPGKKVCVADVANSSLVPIATDQLKARLVEDLQKAQVNANDTSAVTILASEMTVSADNRLVMHRQKCDFMVLSEVAKAKPSGSAADQAMPSLVLDFGLFKKDGTAATKGSIAAESAANSTEAILAAIDKASAQIVPAVPKR
jgi:hypothetical protein